MLGYPRRAKGGPSGESDLGNFNSMPDMTYVYSSSAFARLIKVRGLSKYKTILFENWGMGVLNGLKKKNKQKETLYEQSFL